ncbi:MAG: HAD family hydrolase [Rhodobacteraceae bacterium]|nr:HAD family hydrolase [Paracoccaceae bacterium]
MTLKALIFDVDGTLAETEEAHRRAFNDTFKSNGINWHWDVPLYGELLLTTGGKERMLAYQAKYHADKPQMSFDKIAALHRQKTTRYVEILASGGLALRPGVADLIKRATAAGIRLAIATTTSRPNVDALTKCCWGKPADEIFEVIATGEQVNAKKPAPDLFELALNRLQLSPESCLAFEDSGNGVLSAIGAGIKTIVTPCCYTENHDFTGAARVIPTLEDFPLG